MSETFIWPIKNKVRIRNKPRVKKMSFGDGYEQRVRDGLNTVLPTYNVTIIPAPSEISAVEDFLIAHAGAQSFTWTPAHRTSALFVCENWTVSDETQSAVITAVFREVPS